ncbi:MAG: condensation domain-containing protein, partial [Candidatus Aminicenantes bacterium]
MSDIITSISTLSSGEKQTLVEELLGGKLSQWKTFPLSFAQQRLWFLDGLQPGNPAYNIPVTFRLAGSLDVIALEQSLNEIVQRHAVFRTSIAVVSEQPLQAVSPTPAFNLPVVDFSLLPGSGKEVEIQRLLIEEGRRPFHLDKAPLFRMILIVRSHDEHLLFLNMHHIISDSWSTGIFIRELSSLYDAFSAGEASPLPKLPLQYADFAQWQRSWLAGEVLAHQLSFWKQYLSGIPLLRLPTDRSRTTLQTYRGSTQSLLLPGDLSEAIKQLSHDEGVTLFMTLLAAFKTLLYRYTGQKDIVVGSPIASRNRLEIEGLMGFFTNTLVLRTDLSGNPCFRELLVRVRQSALGAFAHQDMPFEKLVEELQPERSLSRSPLFQVMFVLQDAPMAPRQLRGLTLTMHEVDNRTSKFDVLLAVMETGSGIMASLQYNTDLFTAARMKRMLGHYRILLKGIADNPQQRISELPL